ncbi:MAG: SAM-dependent methyltransferase [Firmicutes bacterium]|nr:SAM-dependent methyltransferase [Bacillota bacterium]
MLNKLFNYLRKPKLYEESSKEFWNDEYISKKLLAAHLDSNFEGASRKHDFINRSVDWISQVTPIASHKKVLDLGCGPGLYTRRLAEKGYLATGIDFSKRSIEYARQKAQEKHLSIEYIYKNYLEIDYENEFDLVILIYCDFAVLSYNQRELLLKKIYGAMKYAGKFIFDVFTPKSYEGKSESNVWSLSDAGGFWQDETYLSMQSYYIYEDKVTLDQYVIVDKDENINVYRMWNQCYTEDIIIHELKNAGFEKIQIYSDVTGKLYNEESKTMCIVVEK